MDNFKSFNEFRKEQHAKQLAEEKQPITEKPNTSPMPPPEEEAHKPHKTIKTYRIYGWWQYMLVFLAAVLLGVLSLFILPVPLGEIQLTGTTSLTMDDVLFEGEIKQPVNVLQINGTDLEEKLSHDIRVSKVQVTRHFPLTVEVSVEDRIPLAVVQGELSYAFLDKDGMVIDSMQSIRKVNVPMITGKRLGNLLLGDVVQQEDIDKALNFLNHLSEDGRKAFSEINIGNAGNIRAYTRDGITVRLGDGADMAKQAELAENMVGDVKARGLSVEYVDANLTSPFIKLKK